MRNLFQLLLRDERGVSALEYAILAGMIVVVVVGAMTVFGTSLTAAFTALGTAVEAAASGTPPVVGG